MPGPSKLICGVVILVTSVSSCRSQPTQPWHPLTRGMNPESPGRGPVEVDRGMGGGCGYLQNLDY
jgi:hypothetical protein